MKSKDFDLDFARRERYTYTKIISSQGKVPGKSFGGSNTMSVALNTKHLSGFINEEEYAAIYPQVEAAHKQLEAKSGPGNDFLGWMYLPRDYDKEEFERIKAAAKKIREDSDVLVVAGIGGSYLGARAVVEAVKGQFHNELEDGPKIYFCGNSISPTYLNNIISLCKGKRFSINVISKSGTTTEPAIAFRIFKAALEKKYGAEGAKGRIYATTDKARGALKTLADREGYESFVVPDNVGGRYSVLTAVGLLPIAVAGVDTDALLAGAHFLTGVEALMAELAAEEPCLLKFGLIPELVGRLPVITALSDLDKAALVRILTEPKNCLVSQYKKLFDLDKVDLEFTPEALDAIAEKTIARKTGARGLRSIMEDTLKNLMFEVPSDYTIEKITVTKDSVENGAAPEIVHNPDRVPVKIKMTQPKRRARKDSAS